MRPSPALAPHTPVYLAFQFEGACIQQRLVKNCWLLPLLTVTNVAGAKPVPIALPPVVRIAFMWVGGHVRRSGTSLGPVSPFLNVFQLQCACIQQRLLERQELLVFKGIVTGAKPVPIALPPVVFVVFFWVRGHVCRPGTCLGPVSPFADAFQLECACIHQRLLERQEG